MYFERSSDTIIAPATTPGTGAICVLRLSGCAALSLGDKVIHCSTPISEIPGGCFRFGRIFDSKGSLLDEVVVSVYRAPHSYTGEDSLEISCHSSTYIVNTMLGLFVEAGARLAEPGEFTKRAFLAGKMDLAQAEAVADVIASSSRAAHDLAISQMKGGVSSALAELRTRLVRLSSLLELELDFSEEEVEFASRQELLDLCSSCIRELECLESSYTLGNAYKRGIPTVIAGAPNAGKSTLLNLLVGEDRAIVSPIAGTTRDTIEESIVLEGMEFRFIDTAGLRSGSDLDAIETIGIERSFANVEKALAVICLLDSTATEAENESVLSLVKKHLSPSAKLFVAINKCDIASSEAEGLKISARSGDGLSGLKDELVAAFAAEGASSNEILISSTRHRDAIATARKALENVISGIGANLPGDLLAIYLHDSINSLGSISGQDLITPQETLNSIFSSFCIGK